MLGSSAVLSAAAAIHARAIGQRRATTARPNLDVIGHRGSAASSGRCDAGASLRGRFMTRL
jgi:hypothetical protein